MESQLTRFEGSFVRISTEYGLPVGAGFLISEDGHVLTCAHVVAAALEIPDNTEEKPHGVVHLDFPFLGAVARRAEVEHWQPLSGPSTNPRGDIAVLRLTAELPDNARPASLTVARELFGREFHAHGYPKGHDPGVWTFGVLRNRLGNGWLQVEDTKEAGVRIQKGFSGSPVQDRATGRFVGMVAASSEYVKAAKVGYVIPTEVLVQSFPQVPVDEVADPEQQDLPKAQVIAPSNTDEIQLLRSLEGHLRGVSSVAFSPDGRLIASGGEDGIVMLWRIADGALLRTHKHKKGVNGVLFSSQGGLLATGADDSKTRLWSVYEGYLMREMGDVKAQIRRIATLGVESYAVTDIAISPNGRLLASAVSDQGILLWNVEDGTLVKSIRHRAFPHSTVSVQGVAFSPDGRLLASGTNRGQVCLFLVGDNSRVRTIEMPGRDKGPKWLNHPSVESVAFSPDGRLIAASSHEGWVFMWRVTDGTRLHRLQKNRFFGGELAFSPDGQLLASTSFTTVSLWRVKDGKLLHSKRQPGYSRTVNTVAFSPDGRLIALGLGNGTVQLWNVA